MATRGKRTTTTAVKKEEKKDPIRPVEIGATGLDVIGGQIREEFLPELIGSQGMEIYREMESNSPVVGAILFAIRNLIRQVDWSVSSVSAKAEDEQAAEFLRTCMHDMQHTWGEFVDEVLSMLVYGFALHEPVYKRRVGPGTYDDIGDILIPDSSYDDGAIGWHKLAPRGQTTVWEWNVNEDTSDVRSIIQRPPPTWRTIEIPYRRLLHFRPMGQKANPEGRSVLRNAYRPYYFAKHIENLEGIGIERDLVGIPVIGVPPALFEDSTQLTKLNSYKELGKNLHQNEQACVVMPLDYDANGRERYKVELLSVSSRRMFDTSTIIQRHEQRIAQTVLADFIQLGHEGVGSYALADSKTKLFSTAIGTWLSAICQVLNRHAVPRLFRLNPQMRVKEFPEIQHGDIESQDLAALAQYLTALAGSGFPLFPSANGELEEHLLRAANLPIPAGGVVPYPADEFGDDEMADAPEEKPEEEETPSEPSTPEEKPATEPEVPEGIDVAPGEKPAEVSLNGAQVSALVDVVVRVNLGELSRESAKGIILAAFPVTEAQAESILGPKITPPRTSEGEDAAAE